MRRVLPRTHEHTLQDHNLALEALPYDDGGAEDRSAAAHFLFLHSPRSARFDGRAYLFQVSFSLWTLAYAQDCECVEVGHDDDVRNRFDIVPCAPTPKHSRSVQSRADRY
jgi:hypothetical protein